VSLAPLSEEQLQAARARATEARRRRARVKQQLRDGTLTLAEVLDGEMDDAVAQLRVVEVLKCLPRVGEKTAHAVMQRIDIADNRRLRGLGKHQIARLKEEFGHG